MMIGYYCLFGAFEGWDITAVCNEMLGAVLILVTKESLNVRLNQKPKVVL